MFVGVYVCMYVLGRQTDKSCIPFKIHWCPTKISVHVTNNKYDIKKESRMCANTRTNSSSRIGDGNGNGNSGDSSSTVVENQQ